MKHRSPSFTHPSSHSVTQFSQSDDSTGKQCLIHSMLHRHTSYSYYRDLWDKEEGEFANSACPCPVSNSRWHWLTNMKLDYVINLPWLKPTLRCYKFSAMCHTHIFMSRICSKSKNVTPSRASIRKKAFIPPSRASDYVLALICLYLTSLYPIPSYHISSGFSGHHFHLRLLHILFSLLFC